MVKILREFSIKVIHTFFPLEFYPELFVWEMWSLVDGFVQLGRDAQINLSDSYRSPVVSLCSPRIPPLNLLHGLAAGFASSLRPGSGTSVLEEEDPEFLRPHFQQCTGFTHQREKGNGEGCGQG